MGWIITILIIFLLLILPLGVYVSHDTAGTAVKIIAGPVRITVFPITKRTKSKPKTKKKTTKTQKEHHTAKMPKSAKNNDVKSFFPLLWTALEFLGAFRRKLRVDRLYMRLIMAASDPCDLAINYGRAQAAMGNLLPQLERVLVIRKRDVEVECDFVADNTVIVFYADITITLGRLLYITFVYGLKILWQFLSIKKMKKGGANQ